MMNKLLTTLFLLCIGLMFNTLCITAAPRNFTVVIDAGHGGHDPGAVSRDKKVKEKDINLRTALALGRLIEQNCPDVRVVYTRKTDKFVELNQRAQIANNAKADLFVSIHTNAVAKGTAPQGAETYTLGMARAGENLEVAKKENSVILMESGYKETYKGFNPNSSESYIIFEFMQDKNMNQSVNFAKKVQQQFRKAGRVDKGVHQAGFLVLRETAMPSVLVELGYITNPNDKAFLATSNGTDIMARSIYNAFISYKTGRAPQTDYTQLVTPTPTPQSQTQTQMTVVVPAPRQDQDVRRGEETGQREEAVADSDGRIRVNPIPDASHKLRNGQPVQAPAGETVAVTPPATDGVPTVIPVVTTPQAETRTVAVEAPDQKPAARTAERSNEPVFKIQILTALQKLPAKDRQFKGLKVEFFRENNKYKYTHGASTNYNEILKLKKTITSKFADCFIVAFRNGQRMDVNEAIKEFKNRKKK